LSSFAAHSAARSVIVPSASPNGRAPSRSAARAEIVAAIFCQGEHRFEVLALDRGLLEGGPADGGHVDEVLTRAIDRGLGAEEPGADRGGGVLGDVAVVETRRVLAERGKRLLEPLERGLELDEVERARLSFHRVDVAEDLVHRGDVQRRRALLHALEQPCDPRACALDEADEELGSAGDEAAHRLRAPGVGGLLTGHRLLEAALLAHVRREDHDAIDGAALHHRSELELEGDVEADRPSGGRIVCVAHDGDLLRRELRELGPAGGGDVERGAPPLLERDALDLRLGLAGEEDVGDGSTLELGASEQLRCLT
jgi:hypothetical protein